MKLKEFGFRNICSFGNKLQEVSLSNKPELILIKGENGHGKTTICNSLTYSLYGKTTKRKVKDLANRVNKNGYTFVNFETSDGRDIELHRGITPNFFELKIDNETKTVAGKDKLDSIVENQLVGIPFDVFSNTILLSVNDFKSFIKMKADDKRKIVNKIFPMEKIDKLHEILKDDVRVVNEEYNKIKHTIESQEVVLGKHNIHLSELEDALKKNDESKIKEISGKIKDLKERVIKDIESNIKTLEDKKKEINDKLEKEIKKEEDTFKSKKSSIEEEINKNKDKYNNILENLREGTLGPKKDELKGINEVYDKKKSDVNDKLEKELKVLSSEEEIKKKEVETKVLDKIVEFSQEMDKHIKENDKLRIEKDNTLGENKKEIDELNQSYSDMKGIAHSLKTSLDVYDKEDECPTCKSDLKAHDHATIKNQIKESIKKTVVKVKELKSKLIDKEELYNKLENDYIDRIYKLNDKIDDLSKKVDKLKTLKDSKIKEVEYKYKDDRNKLEKEASKVLSVINDEYESKVKELEAKYNDIIIEAQSEKNKELSDIVDGYLKDIDTLRDSLNEFKKDKKEVSDDLNSKIDKKINDNNIELASKNKDLELLENELKDISSGKETKDKIKNIKDIVSDVESELEKLNEELIDKENKINKFKVVKELFNDDGLKKLIMNKFLPIFNKTIESLINELEYDFYFQFDDKFNPYITHLGEEVDIESPSAGEGKLMDIIVILAMLELIKYKNPEMNMLFLDEIFNSLDTKNIEKVTAILKRYTIDYNMKIFLISHTPVPMEYFDKTIEVTKSDYFSDLKII